MWLDGRAEGRWGLSLTHKYKWGGEFSLTHTHTHSNQEVSSHSLTHWNGEVSSHSHTEIGRWFLTHTHTKMRRWVLTHSRTQIRRWFLAHSLKWEGEFTITHSPTFIYMCKWVYPTAKFVGQGVVLARSMQYVTANIRQWRVVAVVRLFVSLQGSRAIWPWCTSRRRRMGDVAEQPVGNAKATFSLDMPHGDF
jgi:hypothetical protein